MIEYRSYIIQPSEWLPVKYEYHRGDGDRVRTADSVEEAKGLIDDMIDSKN
jgi:hypothetical protein